MIVGQVSPDLEATISVTVLDAELRPHVYDSVIDTGFSGHLTLPLEVIAGLNLTFAGDQTFSLGNNEEVRLDLYGATLLWDGEELDILVVASDAQPLAGMSLLKGNLIYIDAIDGGVVRVERRPAG